MVTIDPEVRALVDAGPVRVLVELRAEPSADPRRRAEAIEQAQAKVLAALPASHATLKRRYTSLPLLALEIDRAGLSALEAMTDVVVAVKTDRVSRPQ